MRGRLRIAVVALLLVGFIAGWFWFTQPMEEAAVQQSAAEPARASVAQRARTFDPVEWAPPALSVEELAKPGGTPPLKNPATARDGHLVVTVLSQGKPVQTARVRVYLRGPAGLDGTSQSQWRLAGGGDTDSTGVLRVAARPGKYVVAVRREGFATALREVTRLPGAHETHLTVSLEAGAVLRGRVVERHKDEPVPLAELALARFTVAATGAIDSPLEETLQANANERGRFEIAGLEAGSYRLQVTAPGHAKSTQSLTLPRVSELVISLVGASGIEGRVVLEDGRPAGGAQVIAVGTETLQLETGPEGTFAGEVSPGTYRLSAKRDGQTGTLSEPVVVAQGQTVQNLVVRLDAASAVEGQVRARRNGAPVAGARVHLSPFHGEGMMGEALTGPDGRFTIEGLAPGPYDVGADAEGFSPYARTGVSLNPAQRFPLTIELTELGSVTGVVRDAGGAPAPNVRVEAVRMWGTSAFTWGPTHEALTAADGTFAFPEVEVGRVRISAGHGGEAGWLARQLVAVDEGKPTHVELSLRGVGNVTGRVTRRGGGPPDREVLVRAMPSPWVMPGEERFSTVGADGRYRLELTAGRFVLHVVPADSSDSPGRPSSVAVQIEAGQTVERNLEVPDESQTDALLTGIILEPSGTPSPNAFVLASDAEVTTARPNRMGTASDARGEFTLFRPPTPGFGVLDVVAANGGRVGRARGVRSGTRLELRLTQGGVVEGKVTGLAEGEPYRVSYTVTEQGFPAWSGDPLQFTGGTFSLRDVPAARVRISVTTDSGGTGSEEVTVPSGGRASVSVAVEGAATVVGRLTDGKNPVSPAFLRLDGTGVWPGPGTDGRFELTHVARGDHVLSASSPAFRPLERRFTVAPGEKLDLGEITLSPKETEPGNIGVTWGAIGDAVAATVVMAHSPAERAGVRGGDVLLAIDGERVISAADAEERSRGAPGSTVRLSLRRGSSEALDLSVQRAGGVSPGRQRTGIATR